MNYKNVIILKYCYFVRVLFFHDSNVKYQPSKPLKQASFNQIFTFRLSEYHSISLIKTGLKTSILSVIYDLIINSY